MAFPFSITWNENDPADTDLASLLGDDIRDLKLQIRERIDVEHFFPLVDDDTTGYHRQGSARPFYQSTAPANNPDAPGAIWINDTTGEVKRDNGTTWDSLSLGVPAGTIAMWSGLIAAIPDGWKLCDGSAGTPDLRERFIRGAPAATDPGGVGGSDDHSHNGLTGVNTGSGTVSGVVPLTIAAPLDPHVHAFVTDPADGRPPYFELAFIMKS
jgi:hypothetical protein